MTKKFRFMTGLLAVVLAFVMLSSVAYIAAESDHDCTGVDCPICHQINICENLLKSIGLAGSAAAAAAAILYILCRKGHYNKDRKVVKIQNRRLHT